MFKKSFMALFNLGYVRKVGHSSASRYLLQIESTKTAELHPGGKQCPAVEHLVLQSSSFQKLTVFTGKQKFRQIQKQELNLCTNQIYNQKGKNVIRYKNTPSSHSESRKNLLIKIP